MSELATIARPYAEAVFKRAKDSGGSAKWSEMLSFLNQVMSNKEILKIVDNPKVSEDQLNQFIQDIAQGQINEEGSNFLKLLVQNNRLTILPTIAELFESYKADDEGYVEVDLFSAYSLTKEQKNKIELIIEKSFNKKVHMHLSVDKSLIGGFYVRAGDQVIDGSIKGQLQQLAKQL